MRYILYLFTLALVFTSGMLVGNLYIPDHSTSLSAAISIPDAEVDQTVLSLVSSQQAQTNLDTLDQALTSCPLVVNEEKDRLFNELSLFLALQDFQVKKAVYAAEISKNITGTRPTAQFNQAAKEYTLAKDKLEQLAALYFPPKEPQEPAALPPETVVSTVTVSTTTVVTK